VIQEANGHPAPLTHPVGGAVWYHGAGLTAILFIAAELVAASRMLTA
jgi:hypothetical protein